jgi:hypothetical protein
MHGSFASPGPIPDLWTPKHAFDNALGRGAPWQVETLRRSVATHGDL